MRRGRAGGLASPADLGRRVDELERKLDRVLGILNTIPGSR